MENNCNFIIITYVCNHNKHRKCIKYGNRGKQCSLPDVSFSVHWAAYAVQCIAPDINCTLHMTLHVSGAKVEWRSVSWNELVEAESWDTLAKHAVVVAELKGCGAGTERKAVILRYTGREHG